MILWNSCHHSKALTLILQHHATVDTSYYQQNEVCFIHVADVILCDVSFSRGYSNLDSKESCFSAFISCYQTVQGA
jgi:hypothetical protein